MWKAARAITRLCRCCGHGERSLCYSSALAYKHIGDLEEAVKFEEHEALACKVSSALAGIGLSPSHQRTLCSPRRLSQHITSFEGLGIHTDGFCKILSVFPQALILDPDTDLKVAIAHLEEALGKSLLRECILSWPSLLGLGLLHESTKKLDLANQDLESTFLALGSLQHDLGFSQDVLSFKDSTGSPTKSECSIQEANFDSRSMKLRLPQQEFLDKIDFFLKCGFKRNTRLLGRALFCALHKSKQDLDMVVRAFTSLGLSRNHAVRLIKMQPPILQQRPADITPKLDYILNTLSFSIEDLFKYSSFMLYNLETHIRPRYLMHGWIKSKRLLRRNFKLDYIMSMPEKQFLRKFVDCHECGVNVYHGFMQSGE